MPYTKLLSPLTMGGLALPNRVVMAPLTRARTPDGMPGRLQQQYYAQRASAGLIINEVTSAEVLIADGLGDAVAFGRPYIAKPDLVERFRQESTLNTPDPRTFYGGDSQGYTDYPALG